MRAFLLVFLYPPAAALLLALVRNKVVANLVALGYSLVLVYAAAEFYTAPPEPGDHFRVDELGRLLFALLTAVNLFSTVYGFDYFRHHEVSRSRHSLYWIAYLAFVGCMAGVLFANHLGLVWVFLGATTLIAAFLINHAHGNSSLEAAWKYLFIGSIGIALAFVGIIFFALALPDADALFFTSAAGDVDGPWLRVAFVFLVVGFGTLMGLAPVHAWLPAAHSESPAPVSALLSAASLTTAFLAILRVYGVVERAGEGDFARGILLLMGFLSLLIAATYLPRVTNYKRLLAYSSMEHMGLLAVAIGVGTGGMYAAMLHLVGHSLAKSLLFLTAGTILIRYGSPLITGVRGLLTRDKTAGLLWLAGFVCTAGLPPSPLFVSEFLVFSALLTQGRLVYAVAFALLLTVILAGYGRVAMAMLGGSPGVEPTATRPGPLAYAPQLVALAAILVLGVWMPDQVDTVLIRAAEAIR